eukprot:scaffold7066_cov253-Pinguiococcus_pyrenoidosus.AAC.16
MVGIWEHRDGQSEHHVRVRVDVDLRGSHGLLDGVHVRERHVEGAAIDVPALADGRELPGVLHLRIFRNASPSRLQLGKDALQPGASLGVETRHGALVPRAPVADRALHAVLDLRLQLGGKGRVWRGVLQRGFLHARRPGLLLRKGRREEGLPRVLVAEVQVQCRGMDRRLQVPVEIVLPDHDADVMHGTAAVRDAVATARHGIPEDPPLSGSIPLGSPEHVDAGSLRNGSAHDHEDLVLVSFPRAMRFSSVLRGGPAPAEVGKKVGQQKCVLFPVPRQDVEELLARAPEIRGANEGLEVLHERHEGHEVHGLLHRRALRRWRLGMQVPHHEVVLPRGGLPEQPHAPLLGVPVRTQKGRHPVLAMPHERLWLAREAHVDVVLGRRHQRWIQGGHDAQVRPVVGLVLQMCRRRVCLHLSSRLRARRRRRVRVLGRDAVVTMQVSLWMLVPQVELRRLQLEQPFHFPLRRRENGAERQHDAAEEALLGALVPVVVQAVDLVEETDAHDVSNLRQPVQAVVLSGGFEGHLENLVPLRRSAFDAARPRHAILEADFDEGADGAAILHIRLVQLFAQLRNRGGVEIVFVLRISIPLAGAPLQLLAPGSGLHQQRGAAPPAPAAELFFHDVLSGDVLYVAAAGHVGCRHNLQEELAAVRRGFDGNPLLGSRSQRAAGVGKRDVQINHRHRILPDNAGIWHVHAQLPSRHHLLRLKDLR